MTTRAKTLLSIFVTLIALGSGVSAETVRGTIIRSLPYTIKHPGTYILIETLTSKSSTEPAIKIESSHVILDLNGHSIIYGGATPAPDAAKGIIQSPTTAEPTLSDIAIKNGSIIGFSNGVYTDATTSRGFVLDGLRIESSDAFGIFVSGVGTVVNHCTVINTGNTGSAIAYGIALFGVFARVTDCDVQSTVSNPSGVAIGIYASVTGAVIRNSNCANGAVINGSIGIFINEGFASGNTVISFDTGINGTETVKTLNNLTVSCNTQFVGCTSAGGNN